MKPNRRPKTPNAAPAVEPSLAAAAAALAKLLDVADPRQLKPGELLRTLNSTPLGPVLDARKLARLRERAGLAICSADGKRLDLLRFAAWLASLRKTVRKYSGGEHPTAQSGGDGQQAPAAATNSAAAPGGDRPPPENAAVDPHALPKLLWVRWSGRQHKILNDQARLYGMPVGGPTIDMAEVARWIHNLLAEYGRRLLAGDAAADVESGGYDSPALERKREVEFQLKLRDLAERDQMLVHREKIRQGLAAIAGVLRQFGDTLQRQHGPDALDLLNDALADCDRAIEALFGKSLDTEEPNAPASE